MLLGNVPEWYDEYAIYSNQPILLVLLKIWSRLKLLLLFFINSQIESDSKQQFSYKINIVLQFEYCKKENDRKKKKLVIYILVKFNH